MLLLEYPLKDADMVGERRVGRIHNGEPFSAGRFSIGLDKPDSAHGMAAGVYPAVFIVRGSKGADTGVDLPLDHSANGVFEAFAKADEGTREVPAIIVLVFSPGEVDPLRVVEIVHHKRFDTRLRHDGNDGFKQVGSDTSSRILDSPYGLSRQDFELFLGKGGKINILHIHHGNTSVQKADL